MTKNSVLRVTGLHALMNWTDVEANTTAITLENGVVFTFQHCDGNCAEHPRWTRTISIGGESHVNVCHDCFRHEMIWRRAANRTAKQKMWLEFEWHEAEPALEPESTPEHPETVDTKLARPNPSDTTRKIAEHMVAEYLMADPKANQDDAWFNVNDQWDLNVVRGEKSLDAYLYSVRLGRTDTYSDWAVVENLPYSTEVAELLHRHFR